MPDLTLLEWCKRWGVNSSEAIKVRASTLEVELLRESSTKVMCGEKSHNEVVDYLNSMNIPREKIENFHFFQIS